MKKMPACMLSLLLPLYIHAQLQKPGFEDSAVKFQTSLTYKIIPASNHTFGYEIFAGAKLIIYQNCIPAVQGNNGFKTKTGAEKVALLVIDKIKKGEMPPTVTTQELTALEVIKISQ